MKRRPDEYTRERREKAAAMLAAHMQDGAWWTWRDIRKLGLQREEIRDTKLYNERLIGDAVNGVKLIEFASGEEIKHCINSMRKRAREIEFRASCLEESWAELWLGQFE